MLRAIGSKIDISADKRAEEFRSYISDLLESRIVAELSEYTHHLGTTRLQHSLNVAYYNYLICRKLHLDSRSAARAGLLHDLYFYNTREYVREAGERHHPSRHPRMALDNAATYFPINYKESDIILKHMWPMTLSVPRYRETFVITFVDKYCCLLELAVHFKSKLRFAAVARIFGFAK